MVHGSVNLGIAVDLDHEGLIVPVVHDAQDRRLRAIARDVADLAGRAKDRKLTADDITGGTVTITNVGSTGSAFLLPIINQPQVMILSTDGIKRRPVVVTDTNGAESIAIHSVGNLTLGLGPPCLRRRLRRPVPGQDQGDPGDQGLGVRALDPLTAPIVRCTSGGSGGSATRTPSRSSTGSTTARPTTTCS